MGLFSRSELPDLLAPPAPPCVSIYLPASYLPAAIDRSDRSYRNDWQFEEGQLQQTFEQTVSEIHQQLSQSSRISFEVAADFWKAMRTLRSQLFKGSYLADKTSFLTSESLAIFYAPDFLRSYYLPGRLIQTTKIGSAFDLKPLLFHLPQGELFYVLAFGQSQIRLLQGSRQSIRTVNLPELPEPLATPLKLSEPLARSERLIGSRTISRFSFDSSFDDDMTAREAYLKQQMHQSCRQIAEQVDRFLTPQDSPLLLLGSPQILSTYRTINPTRTMLNTEIAGNLETMKLEDLHQQAWSRVQELVSGEREQALRQYEQAAKTGAASNHLGDIITKAINGKVKTLFLSSSYQKWGRFNPYTWEVEVHWHPERGDIDLTQFAVEQTLLQGGTVYVMHPEMFASPCAKDSKDPKKDPKDSRESSPVDRNAFGTIAAILRA